MLAFSYMTKHMNKWLSLTEYSHKYSVSLSTLRRRIKSNKIEFVFNHGKYFLPDCPQPHSKAQPEAPTPLPHTYNEPSGPNAGGGHPPFGKPLSAGVEPFGLTAFTTNRVQDKPSHFVSSEDSKPSSSQKALQDINKQGQLLASLTKTVNEQDKVLRKLSVELEDVKTLLMALN